MIQKHQISIQSRWGKMLEVNCLHTFYRDGQCRDLVFQPTDETARRMNNLRLLFRPSDTGFSILYNEEKLRQLMDSPYLKGGKFSFRIYSRNPNLINFSALPLDADDGIYVFSNTQEQVQDKLKFMHKPPYLPEDKDIRVPLRPRFFHLGLSKPTPYTNIKLLGESGEAVTLPSMKEERAKEKFERQPLDLRSLDEGVYTVQVKGQKDFTFYASNASPEGLFGFLNVRLDDKVPGKYSLFSGNSINSQEYFIRLEGRKTYWRYMLVPQDGKNGNGKYTEVKVSFNGKEIPFSTPVPTVLSNGSPAHYIETTEPQALLEKVSDSEKLEMKLKKDKKWLSKTIRLPLPTTKMVKPDKVSGKVYSVVYVYL